MVNRTANSVSVWWDGQCVTVTLPTTTFYLTIQETRLFGEEVANKLLNAGHRRHVTVARDVLSLEEAWFLADRLQASLSHVLRERSRQSGGDTLAPRLLTKLTGQRKGFNKCFGAAERNITTREG